MFTYISMMIKMLATEIYKDDGAMFDCLVRSGMTMVFKMLEMNTRMVVNNMI